MALLRPRFTLADLLFSVASCALLLAFVLWFRDSVVGQDTGTSSDPMTSYFVLTVAEIALIGGWTVVRALRTAPTCPVCGRRLLGTPSMPEAGLCPSCQQRFVDAAPSRVSARSRQERAKAFGLLLVFLVILSVFFRLTFPGSVDALTGWIVLMILLSLPGLALGAIFAVFVRAFIHAWTPPRTCPTCGRRVFSNPETAAFSSCPGCRQQPVDRAHARHEQRLGWAVTLGLLAIGSTLLGMSLAEFAAADTGWNYWLALPLFTLAIGLALIAALVLIVYLRVRSTRLFLTDERFALDLARKSAGVEGSETRLGQVTIWSSGPGDITPMLQEQLEVSRRRLASLLGAEVEPRYPLRIYCFDKRVSFVGCHRRLLTDPGNEIGT